MHRVWLLLMLAAGVAGCNRLPEPAGMLVIDINPLCTTCVDFIRCDDASSVAGEAESFTLYQLEEKSVLAQIATIWQYFVQYIMPRKVDRRELTIYRQTILGDGRISPSFRHGERAEQDLVRFEIRVPEARIDQQTGAWYASDGRKLGSCRVLSRAEGRELAARLEPQPVEE